MECRQNGNATLRAAPKGTVDGTVGLAPEEDRLLRKAFGRYGGTPEARRAAASVVARYQQMGAGMWLLCPCRSVSGRNAVLVPVAQTHVRRHEADRWPSHAPSCDFYRDPAEQNLLVGSYVGPVDRPFSLARRFGAAEQQLKRSFVANSYATRRPGLARLLMRLVDEAGLQKIPANWQPPPLVDQIKAVWGAARKVSLDAGVALPQFFCPSPGRIGELIEKIEAAPPCLFKRTRPHGVLIARIGSIRAGVLEPIAGEAIPVRGRIAVFGERPGEESEIRTTPSVRAPYLAACVVGRAEDNGPVEVLSAYVHPCAGEHHLMLVDSDYERRTLRQLRHLQAWLSAKRGVSLAIEKPVFDLGPPCDDDGFLEGRDPCLPDFILHATGAGARKTIIVETMGFADEVYRVRKARMHEIMSAALEGAPVVPHEMPGDGSGEKRDRDRALWRGVMGLIGGSGNAFVHHAAREPISVGNAVR